MEDKYIIEFSKTKFTGFKMIKVSEDDCYELLELAFLTKPVIISREQSIFQVSYPLPDGLDDFYRKLYRIFCNGEPRCQYIEKVFKLMDGEPIGFTKDEARQVIKKFLKENHK